MMSPPITVDDTGHLEAPFAIDSFPGRQKLPRFSIITYQESVTAGVSIRGPGVPHVAVPAAP